MIVEFVLAKYAAGSRHDKIRSTRCSKVLGTVLSASEAEFEGLTIDVVF